MSNWMLRGLVFAAAMVVARLFQGTLIDVWQTQAGLISIVVLILFLVGVVVWGISDGRADAAANPDPDRRADLAMRWLLAGLVAGVLSGAVTWLISVFYKSLYVGGLINELTTFAAFTALLVFLGGISGVTLGRWLIDRKGAYAPRPGGGDGDGDEDRVDTDVFAAVRSDEAAAEGREWPQEQQQAVATAERAEHGTAPAYREEAEETTEASSPAPRSEETTEAIPRHETEETTEQVAPEGDADWTKPWGKRDDDQR